MDAWPYWDVKLKPELPLKEQLEEKIAGLGLLRSSGEASHFTKLQAIRTMTQIVESLSRPTPQAS
jgi:hypothetical protein